MVEPGHRMREAREQARGLGLFDMRQRGRAQRGQRHRDEGVPGDRPAHHPPSTISTTRWMVQNAPSEPTT